MDVTGTIVTGHAEKPVDAELVLTGNNTLLLLIATEPTTVQSDRCEEGRWAVDYIATALIDPEEVDTLTVLHNGEQIAIKRNLSAPA